MKVVILAGGLALGGGRILLASAQEGRNSVIWISPRGTLEVFDDYGYWVGKEMGYFGDIETELQPGILEATSGGKAVAEGQADMVGVGRPFYAEPELAARLLAAGDARAACRNANRCVSAQMLGMKGVCYTPDVRRAAVELRRATAG